MYMTYGYWSFSLKNPFYNIISVTSYWIALLHMVLGISNIMYDLPNVMLYCIIALLIMLPIYITYRWFKSVNSTPIAVALALATLYNAYRCSYSNIRNVRCSCYYASSEGRSEIP